MGVVLPAFPGGGGDDHRLSFSDTVVAAMVVREIGPWRTTLVVKKACGLSEMGPKDRREMRRSAR
jgi:hypothetical protein